MTNFKIVLEQPSNNIFDVRVEQHLRRVMHESKDKFDAVENLRAWDKRSKIGSGGNHIWIANPETNEREVIIYLS